jgi:hypothetical protein
MRWCALALLPRAVVHDCTGGRRIATPTRFGAEDRSTGAEHAVNVHASVHAFEMQCNAKRPASGSLPFGDVSSRTRLMECEVLGAPIV